MNAVRQTAKIEPRGVLRLREPLAPYTTWRVGGPAERFYQPADLEDLCVFLSQLPAQEPLFWLGLGSNLLIRDGGIRGTVIATHGALKALALTTERWVRAEAGVPCAKVARFAARQQLVGAEFLAGIPGTVGGALAMNAGAWGGETWRNVRQVETVDRSGRLRLRGAEDFEVGYRHVQGPPNEWFVAAHFGFATGDGERSLVLIRQLLEQRGITQPTGVASCGSVFRNPPGDYAARLIDTAGLKGVRIGAACVSTKHANFIINLGNAKAADLEALVERVAAAVRDTHGVELVTEVRIVGDATGGNDV